ncbi:MAG: hypothetical protein JSS76_06165 [Bacteroidetes bacterium]|nr:hypothetical protein [Bacteroidota bacterium]
MNQLFIYTVLCLLLASCSNNSKTASKSEISIADTCQWKKFLYKSGECKAEGRLCNKLRQGLWRDKYVTGGVIDSGIYERGYYVYNDSLLTNISGYVHFKSRPKKFFKDSVYLFSVFLNVPFHYKDIEAHYLEIKYADRKYDVNINEQPRDSFIYILKPIRQGRTQFRLGLHSKSWVKDSVRHNLFVFYHEDIQVY